MAKMDYQDTLRVLSRVKNNEIPESEMSRIVGIVHSEMVTRPHTQKHIVSAIDLFTECKARGGLLLCGSGIWYDDDGIPRFII